MGSLKTVALAAAMVVFAAAMMSGTAEAQQTCANKLVPCVNYLNGTKPSTECCDSIKEAVAKELPCLCNIYNTPGLLQSFGVSVPQAIKLTESCGVPVRLQDCKGTASAPQAQTPGVPGSDNNGTERTSLAGIFTILMFFVSTLFY